VTSGHPGRVVSYFADDPPAPPHLAISRLTEHPTTVEAFLARHEVPIVEGRYCTFLHRGEADEVRLVHRIVGLPGRLPMRRLAGTDLWHGVLELPEGSRLETWKDSYALYDNDRMWNLIDVLGKIAARHEVTHASVALAWLLARSEVSTIIVGARTVGQLQDNLKALDVKLGADDVKALDAASKPDWGYPQSFIERLQPW